MPIRLLCAALVALPWLWPLTAGPSAGMVPYLVSAVTGALLITVWPAHDREGRALENGATIAASGWLAAALISSVIALLQYFDLETLFYPLVNQAQPGQAFGNLRQPNQLASLLAIGLLALRWLFQRQHLNKFHASWMSALLLVALAATASRVGLVELILLGALVLWWSRSQPGGRTRLMLAGAALGIYLAAALAWPALIQSSEGVAGRDMVERLRTAESTCGSRLILWHNVLHLISLKPWLGWGWGELDYAHYITLYDGPRFCHILDNAHNLPLHLAVELGVPLALLACALTAWLLWRGRLWQEQDASRQLAWGVLGVIGIHSMVEYPLWYGPFQIAAILCVWLLWRPRHAAAELTARPWWRNAIAAAMLVAVAYTAWDYHRISQLFMAREDRSPAYRDNTLAKAQQSWLFSDVVAFAETTTRPATRETAARLLPTALAALHFSPESSTIIKVIECASLLGQDELALAHMARFKAAFPDEYKEWTQDNARVLQGLRQ
ncbi:MAG: Wzy polymerase domain-containing protein [Ottowia sp.]|uniref:PglL family O-oligosaccharyltransferase n=1 Tax=Ottowia sp. TaxID=1898956 RepID=UPI003C76B57F